MTLNQHITRDGRPFVEWDATQEVGPATSAVPFLSDWWDAGGGVDDRMVLKWITADPDPADEPEEQAATLAGQADITFRTGTPFGPARDSLPVQTGRALVVDGWAFHKAVRTPGWRITYLANGRCAAASEHFAGAYRAFRALVELFPNIAPDKLASARPIIETLKTRAHTHTDQEAADMAKRSPEDIERILAAHFLAHPEDWTAGRSGKTAVSKVVALTGVPAATVSTWADNNRPASLRHDEAKAEAVDAGGMPTGIPMTPADAERALIDASEWSRVPLFPGQVWLARNGHPLVILNHGNQYLTDQKATASLGVTEHAPYYVYGAEYTREDCAYPVHTKGPDPWDLMKPLADSVETHRANIEAAKLETAMKGTDSTMDPISNDPTAALLPTMDLGALATGLASLQSGMTAMKAKIAMLNDQNVTLAKGVVDAKSKQEAAEREAESLRAALAARPVEISQPRVMSEGDSSFIPTVDATHIVMDVDGEIDWSLKHSSDLLITGPTGAGKTAPVVQACARAKRPMRRVCFDGEVTSQDLIGRRDAMDGKTIWTDGILPMAMEAGHVLLVDEIDRADESARAALFSVLDSRSLYLPVPNKRVQAAAGFQLIACCNGVGDNSGAYTGTQPIDAAFLGRWLDVVRVEYPTKARELDIVKAHVPGIHEGFAAKLVEFFAVLRKAETDGNLTGPFSIRQSKHLAKLQFAFRAGGANPQQAAARACIRTLVDRTEPDNRATIRETFQRVFGFECKV